MLDTVISYDGDLRCHAENAGSGVIVSTDAPKDHQGLGEGFSPSELLSVSLGSCILTMMGIVARSMGIDIPGATATVSKEMANAPRRIASIVVNVRVPGQFDEQQRASLEAAGRACPVHNVLGIDAPMIFEWAS